MFLWQPQQFVKLIETFLTFFFNSNKKSNESIYFKWPWTFLRLVFFILYLMFQWTKDKRPQNKFSAEMKAPCNGFEDGQKHIINKVERKQKKEDDDKSERRKLKTDHKFDLIYSSMFHKRFFHNINLTTFFCCGRWWHSQFTYIQFCYYIFHLILLWFKKYFPWILFFKKNLN